MQQKIIKHKEDIPISSASARLQQSYKYILKKVGLK